MTDEKIQEYINFLDGLMRDLEKDLNKWSKKLENLFE